MHKGNQQILQFSFKTAVVLSKLVADFSVDFGPKHI